MYIQTNHTIKNPCLFDKNKPYNDYITNHKKNISYLVLKIILN